MKIKKLNKNELQLLLGGLYGYGETGGGTSRLYVPQPRRYNDTLAIALLGYPRAEIWSEIWSETPVEL